MTKRRLQKYVDTEVQSSLLLRLCVHWSLFIVANVFAMLFWAGFMETPWESWDATWSLTWQRVAPFALMSTVLAPVFIWDAVKLSNRFAGPVVRVRRVLAEYADGRDFKAVEFREGDFWKPLATDLNRAFTRKTASEPIPGGDKS